MKLSRTPALAAASLLAVLAGCAATAPDAARNPPNQRLLNSVTQLERSARVLAQRADGIDRAFAQDAHALLSYASEFRTALVAGRASDSDLQGYFDALSSSYDALRSDAKSLDTMQANSAVELVSGPYQDVAAQMSAPHTSL